MTAIRRFQKDLTKLLRIVLLLVVCTLPAISTSALAGVCNLSMVPGNPPACPPGAVGAGSHNPDFDGATINPNTDSLSAIDAFGYCRYVGSQDKVPLFIPFGNAEEWHAYIPNHPLSVYLIQCARGGAIVVPPNFGGDGDENQCVTYSQPQSIFSPYRPINVAIEFTAPPITYECKSSTGTTFNETAVATLTPHDSGYGPSDDIGWRITKMRYSYDAVCGAAQGVEVKTAPKTGLCNVGVPTEVIGIGPFQWVCNSGNGGGKNRTCSTGIPCKPLKDEVRTCRCEEGHCYIPVIHGDDCGHTWVDKSQACDNPEPILKPLPPYDEDNPHMNPNTVDEHAHNIGLSVTH